MKATQESRMLEDLRHARPNWVCGSVWLAKFMPRYSANIWTLRHSKRFVIHSRRCEQHEHEGGLAEFRLVSEPDDVTPQEQLAWLR